MSWLAVIFGLALAVLVATLGRLIYLVVTYPRIEGRILGLLAKAAQSADCRLTDQKLHYQLAAEGLYLKPRDLKQIMFLLSLDRVVGQEVGTFHCDHNSIKHLCYFRLQDGEAPAQKRWRRCWQRGFRSFWSIVT